MRDSGRRTTRIETDLEEMTADRDRWRAIARTNEKKTNAVRDQHDALLAEIARHVVTQLRDAGWVQIHPHGPQPTEQENTSA